MIGLVSLQVGGGGVRLGGMGWGGVGWGGKRRGYSIGFISVHLPITLFYTYTYTRPLHLI